MNLAKKPIGEILNMARAFAKDYKYEKSLLCYEYFFDHSLDDDSSFYYGVRLSYCLSEWAILGNVYPQAKDSLETKRLEVLSSFNGTLKNIHFLEFCSICKYVDKSDDVIDVFLEYHNNKTETSKKIVYLVWELLIKKELWNICSCYPGYIDSIYDKGLDIFDEMLDLYNTHASFQTDEFLSRAQESFIKKINNLFEVLNKNNERVKIKLIQKQIEEDMSTRNYSEIIKNIQY